MEKFCFREVDSMSKAMVFVCSVVRCCEGPGQTSNVMEFACSTILVFIFLDELTSLLLCFWFLPLFVCFCFLFCVDE